MKLMYLKIFVKNFEILIKNFTEAEAPGKRVIL